MTNAAERKARLDQLLDELRAKHPTADSKKLSAIMHDDPEEHRELLELLIAEALERDRRTLDPNFVERH